MAGEVETVASAALKELIGIPGVRRAGIALSEGGGRRLKFRASDSDGWCHIDAYDDVPLTAVVRTGRPLLAAVDDLRARFGGVVDRQRADGTVALAALPLPGRDRPIGGVVLYYDTEQGFDRRQRGLLDAVARRIAESVRRVRAAAAARPAVPDHPDVAHRATLLLEDDARAARRARHFLRGLLRAWQIGGDVPDTAELCLSELVTNAVIHAGTDSLLTISLVDGALTVQVRDRGADSDDGVGLVDDEDPLRVFGRGLQLVDALADRWGSEQDAHGTTSWFVLEVSSAA